jgi:hypothetical protein
MNADYDCPSPPSPAETCGPWPAAALLLVALRSRRCDAPPQPRTAPAIDADRPKPVRVAEVEVAAATRELRLPGVRARGAARRAGLPAAGLPGRALRRARRPGRRPGSGSPACRTRRSVRPRRRRGARARTRRAPGATRGGLPAGPRAATTGPGLGGAARSHAGRAQRRRARRAQALAGVAEARDQLADACCARRSTAPSATCWSSPAISSLRASRCWCSRVTPASRSRSCCPKAWRASLAPGAVSTFARRRPALRRRDDPRNRPGACRADRHRRSSQLAGRGRLGARAFPCTSTLSRAEQR